MRVPDLRVELARILGQEHRLLEATIIAFSRRYSALSLEEIKEKFGEESERRALARIVDEIQEWIECCDPSVIKEAL
jgi:hypothetical protein